MITVIVLTIIALTLAAGAAAVIGHWLGVDYSKFWTLLGRWSGES